MSEIEINQDQYLEVEKLALGAFQPLSGFMNEEAFHSVVNTMRLPGGEVFTLPVILDVTPEQARTMKGRPSVALIFHGVQIGTLAPDSFYRCDRKDVAQKIFGTTDAAHPGVAHLMSLAPVFVGGAVTLTQKQALAFSDQELTPQETRAEFKKRGWTTVVGFQTRNVPHRAHEYLQRVALEQCDGLFIQPLVGRKKVGDFTTEAVLAGYHALIDGFYRQDRVLLGVLSTSMRFAGPREAIFHAIVRRNYGCTHFIVGRDHAGVGGYYGLYDAHALSRRFDGELGIEVMRLHGPYYCDLCDGVVTEHTCPHKTTHPERTTEISGGMIRAHLANGTRPPGTIMRPDVIDALEGVPLFFTES